MRQFAIVAAVVAASLVSSPPAAAQTPKETAMASCVASFQMEGSFWRGRTFRGQAETVGVSAPNAVQRVAQALSLQSIWRDVRADQNIGTVSATMGVTGNDDALVPLNIVVQDAGDGRLNVVARLSTRPGLMVQLDPIRNMLCDAAASAAGA